MGELRVEDVTVAFGPLTALDNVSLTIRESEVVGVIGPNGAGKTTLFNVICGFVRPSEGRLQLGDTVLRKHKPHDLAGHGIARTLQGVGLWSGLSVVENVMSGATSPASSGLVSGLLGLRRSTRGETTLRRRAMDALEELRIAEYAPRLPPSLPYAIQKRVALARALVSDPSLLLLDEPASGLSEAEMDELGTLIRALRARMSVLLVEHHMDLVMAICDRLIVLDFGRLIASGSPEEIRSNPAVTRAYLGVDVSDVDSTMSDDSDDRPQRGDNHGGVDVGST